MHNDGSYWCVLVREQCRNMRHRPHATDAADCGIIASRDSETISRVAAEWMASGRVLIGTRMHAVAEAIEDEVTGWLVQPGDVEQLANAMRRTLALDPARRAAMEIAARTRAEHAFSLATFGAALESYCELVCHEAH